jgi:hypothetical protein
VTERRRTTAGPPAPPPAPARRCRTARAGSPA